MPAVMKSPQQLRSIDDLFGLNDNIAFHTAQDCEPQNLPDNTRFEIVKFEIMDDYPGNPFKLYGGEREIDMIESIRNNGILQPFILRDINAPHFQLLSGHNRKDKGIKAGLIEGPAIIKSNLTDEEAWTYVIETNLIQRSFADMLPSEKAAVLAEFHANLFSQGKRNDIINEIKSLENASNAKEKSTSVEFNRSSGSRESLATEYGLTANQVAMYLRVNRLIQPLKERLDKGEFELSPASTLSFLKEPEQSAVDKCVELNGFKLDVKKTNAIYEYSKANKLKDENVFLILSGEAVRSPTKDRTPTVKVNKAIYAKYFSPEQSAKEVQSIVEKALDLYFKQTA